MSRQVYGLPLGLSTARRPLRYTPGMSERRIVASTAWQLLSQAAMAALSVVTVKCVAVGLSMESAGIYNSAYGFLQIFGILADFGLYAVAVREVSRSGDRASTLGALLVLRAGILTLSLGSALLFAWALPAWRGTPLPAAVTVAAAVPALTLLAGVLRAAFQAAHAMQYVFVAEVTQRLVTVALLGTAVLLGVRGSSDPRVLLWFLGVGAAGAGVLLGLSLFFLRRVTDVRWTFHGAEIRRLLLLALPYGAAFLATALYRQSDVALIALLRADFAFQNASYGFVQRVMDMAYLFPTFLLNAALPHITGRADADGPLLRRALVGTVLLAGGCALFAALWARPLMALLTTDAYLSRGTAPGADTALELLSASMFCNGIIVFGFYVLLAAHRWRPLVCTLAVAAALSVSLNLPLITQFGFVGASMTSVVVHVFAATALFFHALRATGLRLPWRGLARTACWLLLLTALLLAVRPLLTAPGLTVAGIAACGAAALALARLLGLQRELLGGAKADMVG